MRERERVPKVGGRERKGCCGDFVGRVGRFGMMIKSQVWSSNIEVWSCLDLLEDIFEEGESEREGEKE